MNAAEDTTEQGWKLLDRTVVHRGRVILSQHSIELPNGERSLFEVDESIPFGVAVLLADSSGMLHISRQYRYPINRWIYDLPGGGGNVGEEPRAAARRECLEEIGMIPIELEHLHTFYLNPGRRRGRDSRSNPRLAQLYERARFQRWHPASLAMWLVY